MQIFSLYLLAHDIFKKPFLTHDILNETTAMILTIMVLSVKIRSAVLSSLTHL